MQMYIRNVNEALERGVDELLLEKSYMDAREVAPRGMKTLEFSEPVVTIYRHPNERVLFSAVRDANPFLHFFESLWMLAGRQDVGFLTKFASRMAEFSDDGERLNGAYGWRWRNEFGFDQLQAIVELLKTDPDSRRAVLTMWQAGDLRYNVQRSKDVPCNTQIYFKLRDGKLNMTVCCRSNDMIWGAYGANAVHFSMLMEYVANKLEVEVGVMHQMSDSLHVYLPPHPSGVVWERLCKARGADKRDLYASRTDIKPYPLGASGLLWDKDLRTFFGAVDCKADIGTLPAFHTAFFRDVVDPLWTAWDEKDPMALEYCEANDWRAACEEWFERRVK